MYITEKGPTCTPFLAYNFWGEMCRDSKLPSPHIRPWPFNLSCVT